jgi:hypothetical protein
MENGKILEDIRPCEDSSLDAAIPAQIIHEYNNSSHPKVLGMTPVKKHAMMLMETEVRIGDEISDNLNWVQPIGPLPRMARRLPTQSMCRVRDLT